MSAALEELAAFNRRKAAEYQRKNFANIPDRSNGLPSRFTGKKDIEDGDDCDTDDMASDAATTLTAADLQAIGQAVLSALNGQADNSGDEMVIPEPGGQLLVGQRPKAVRFSRAGGATIKVSGQAIARKLAQEDPDRSAQEVRNLVKSFERMPQSELRELATRAKLLDQIQQKMPKFHEMTASDRAAIRRTFPGWQPA